MKFSAFLGSRDQSSFSSISPCNQINHPKYPINLFPAGIKREMATKKCLGNLTEAELRGKTVFLRADLDVPLDDDDQNFAGDTRIRASVPTIKFLTEKGAKVILASHSLPGRPKGVTPKLSLKPLVPRLSELLKVDVVMANDGIGEEEAQHLAASLPDGGVLLLENAMFYEEEHPEFAKKLASVADIYVKNDAFAHGGALPEGEGLQGVFAFDISAYNDEDIDSVMPDKQTSQHISSDDGVIISKLPVGKSRRTLPHDDFAYKVTGSDGSDVFGESGQEGKVIRHISAHDVRGRVSPKVQEGKGLSGVFHWSGNDGSIVTGESWLLEDKKVSHHHISTDGGRGHASMKVKEGRGLPGLFESGDNGSFVHGERGLEDKVSHHILTHGGGASTQHGLLDNTSHDKLTDVGVIISDLLVGKSCRTLQMTLLMRSLVVMARLLLVRVGRKATR